MSTPREHPEMDWDEIKYKSQEMLIATCHALVKVGHLLPRPKVEQIERLMAAVIALQGTNNLSQLKSAYEALDKETRHLAEVLIDSHLR